jgi:Fe-S-cluster containining protein
MQDLITDLDTIARLTDERARESEKFRYFLKAILEWDDEKLDALVHEIAREVTRGVDCTACANCCRSMRIAVIEADIQRLARRLGLTPQEFEAQYVQPIDYGDKVFAQTPCPFLRGNLCSLYEDRPADCAEFPHLLKPDFLGRTFGVLANASFCPIVFNTWERLKSHFRAGRMWFEDPDLEEDGLEDE